MATKTYPPAGYDTDLSEAEWELLKPLIYPADAKRGRGRWRDLVGFQAERAGVWRELVGEVAQPVHLLARAVGVEALLVAHGRGGGGDGMSSSADGHA